MNRYCRIAVVIACLLAAPVRGTERPNIVLMMADDQGWGETGYNGHPHLKTPVLDELAANNLRFDRFYAAAPNCSPTRASILTGRHPNRSGVFGPNHSTRPEEVSIGQLFRDAGYRTGHFGKWHVGAVKQASPTNPRKMGFDEYLSHDNFFEMHPPLSRNGAAPEIHHGESSLLIVEAAEEFVRTVHTSGDAPFFVVIWFGSPHSPYRGLPEDVALYDSVSGNEIRHRFAEITAMDRAIGRFRETLRDMGVANDTLLWYTSDNGMTREGIPAAQREHLWNAGWRASKGSLYEGGIRVPAIIEWPAVVRAPRVTSMPCVTTDIFTTLLGLLELRHPNPARPLDGIDLTPLIVDGAMKTRPHPIGFWKYDARAEKNNPRWMPAKLTKGTTPTTRNPGIDFVNFRHPVAKTENFGGSASWMGNRYKLVSTSRRNGRTVIELFDLLADPQEQTDISTDLPDVVKAMTAQLHDWQRSVELSLSGADYD